MRGSKFQGARDSNVGNIIAKFHLVLLESSPVLLPTSCPRQLHCTVPTYVECNVPVFLLLALEPLEFDSHVY